MGMSCKPPNSLTDYEVARSVASVSAPKSLLGWRFNSDDYFILVLVGGVGEWA